jgi:hypothetical protein
MGNEAISFSIVGNTSPVNAPTFYEDCEAGGVAYGLRGYFDGVGLHRTQLMCR